MKTTRKPNEITTNVEPPSSTDDFQAQDFQTRVAEAAYFQAEQRGFSPGFEMADWLAAEAQVRARSDNA